MVKILIGIQARSTSQRLPGKSLERIEAITMTDHVLEACKSVANHINKKESKFKTHCDVALLVPTGDILAERYQGEFVVTGGEMDVLSRYLNAVKLFDPDYVVRITGDCPLINPPLVTKHIVTAIQDKLDYCSNVYEEVRTFIDGYDVEVISREVMDWLADEVTMPYDREHVTTYFRSHTPKWASVGTVIGHIDLSHIKLSVDTSNDLEAVRANKRLILSKVDHARELGHKVYRF
jgi:spore coat polysaccharide biosynthesis protein SpsF (cytidylyltransferase family)